MDVNTTEVERCRKAIEDAFLAYLRVSRSGGMPRELSDQVEGTFLVFSQLDLAEVIAPFVAPSREQGS